MKINRKDESFLGDKDDSAVAGDFGNSRTARSDADRVRLAAWGCCTDWPSSWPDLHEQRRRGPRHDAISRQRTLRGIWSRACVEWLRTFHGNIAGRRSVRHRHAA